MITLTSREANIMVRGRRATSSGGRGEGSGRRSTPFFAAPPFVIGGAASTSGCLHVCTTRTDTLSTSTNDSRLGCLHICTTRTDALSTSTTGSNTC
ncbi:hypothetical protein Taro_034351 [Colocasia esculenta]|uniref:Uncharacterized protein n=1 Tax=Colocasia esculenta TaxID=4460 RepID=A0A843W9S4_COLES|nr:hypothetical protein [Colocasia esculenta]